MKQPKKTIDITKLDTIIKRWKINIPTISKEIGMPESTFKRKANPADIQYNFTEWEYLEVIRILCNMISDIQGFIRKAKRLADKELATSKK